LFITVADLLGRFLQLHLNQLQELSMDNTP
jgi:hypothetical protein